MSEIDFLVKLRDGATMIADAAQERLEKLAPSEARKPTVTMSEETFNVLKWDPQQGAKLGVYDVAYKAMNLPDKWTQAYNILKQNNATIQDRCHGEGYVFSYWLYAEKEQIYRQKLKAK